MSQRSDERQPSRDVGMAASQPQGLRPLHHQLDRRAVRWWAAQVVSVVTPTVLLLIVLTRWIPSMQSWLALAAGMVAVLGGIYAVVVPPWRYRVHRWETTQEAVYAASGWLWLEWRVAPMSRIQTIDTERGPLQRMFGLATLTITTASAAGAIKISGLDYRVAAALVERLTAQTHAIPGDAT